MPWCGFMSSNVNACEKWGETNVYNDLQPIEMNFQFRKMMDWSENSNYAPSWKQEQPFDNRTEKKVATTTTPTLETILQRVTFNVQNICCSPPCTSSGMHIILINTKWTQIWNRMVEITTGDTKLSGDVLKRASLSSSSEMIEAQAYSRARSFRMSGLVCLLTAYDDYCNWATVFALSHSDPQNGRLHCINCWEPTIAFSIDFMASHWMPFA